MSTLTSSCAAKQLKPYFVCFLFCFTDKYLSELIQSCEERIFFVREFLQELDPNIEYNIVPISDSFGPTKDDPTLEVKYLEFLKCSFCVVLLLFMFENFVTDDCSK